MQLCVPLPSLMTSGADGLMRLGGAPDPEPDRSISTSSPSTSPACSADDDVVGAPGSESFDTMLCLLPLLLPLSLLLAVMVPLLFDRHLLMDLVMRLLLLPVVVCSLVTILLLLPPFAYGSAAMFVASLTMASCSRCVATACDAASTMHAMADTSIAVKANT